MEGEEIMRKQTNSIFIRIRTDYVSGSGNHRNWDYYVELFPRTGCLKVYSPDYTVEEQKSRNFFRSQVTSIKTNKDNLLYEDMAVMMAFYSVAVKWRFAGFNYWQIDKDAYAEGRGTTISSIATPVDGKWAEFDAVKFCPADGWIGLIRNGSYIKEEGPEGVIYNMVDPQR